jgi:hypothetical protein
MDVIGFLPIHAKDAKLKFALGTLTEIGLHLVECQILASYLL